MRLGCAAASSIAPTSRIGSARARYGRPSIVAEPDVGVSRPSSARRVVVFPDPFGPRNPVMLPCRTVKLSPSTAWTGP